MKQLTGLVVNPGIAYGKAYLLKYNESNQLSFQNDVDPFQVLENALKKSTIRLEEQVKEINLLYSQKIAIIFEAHKLMANDPLLLDKTKEYIRQGYSAYAAYKLGAKEIIAEFEKLENEYMRNRIVDIEDATDRVLSTIKEVEYELHFQFPEPMILVMKNMKPSILINCQKESVCGFVSEVGSYNQHSGTIARIKDIPGLIIPDAINYIQDNDILLMDSYEGRVYVNPTEEFVNNYLKERR